MADPMMEGNDGGSVPPVTCSLCAGLDIFFPTRDIPIDFREDDPIPVAEVPAICWSCFAQADGRGRFSEFLRAEKSYRKVLLAFDAACSEARAQDPFSDMPEQQIVGIGDDFKPMPIPKNPASNQTAHLDPGQHRLGTPPVGYAEQPNKRFRADPDQVEDDGSGVGYGSGGGSGSGVGSGVGSSEFDLVAPIPRRPQRRHQDGAYNGPDQGFGSGFNSGTGSGSASGFGDRTGFSADQGIGDEHYAHLRSLGLM